MFVRHSEWVRTCADCKVYLHGPNGKVSTTPGDDGRGNLIELPMLMKECGLKPNCAACPKLEGVERKEPLAEDLDFGEWFIGLWESYYEGKACGFPPLDPLTRACYSIIAEAVDARNGEAETTNLLGVMLRVFKR